MKPCKTHKIIEDDIEYEVFEYPNGTKEWFLLNDRMHRINGPAMECDDGTKHWVFHGKYHRIDGPATEYSNGKREWWLNGKKFKTEESYWMEILKQ